MFFKKEEEIERLNKKCCEQEIDIDFYKSAADYQRHARIKESEQVMKMYDNLEDKSKDLQDKYRNLDDSYGILQREYLNIIRKHNDDQATIDRTRRIFEKELSKSEKQILTLLALLVGSKELVSMTFSKSRLDECLSGENDKFYIYLINYNGYYTWKFDIKYWDLFPVPITVPANCKKVDNITELLKGY